MTRPVGRPMLYPERLLGGWRFPAGTARQLKRARRKGESDSDLKRAAVALLIETRLKHKQETT